MAATTQARPAGTSSSSSRSSSARPLGKGAKRETQTLKTWVFDSVGPRKYAVQIQKAGNGNPCLKIVEGTPQPDGTYRKFHLLVWSEDFDAFFRTLDEARAYMTEHGVKTPDGHSWRPGKGKGRAGAQSKGRAPAGNGARGPSKAAT